MAERSVLAVRRVEIERVSVESAKPFDLIVTALEEAVGHPDMANGHAPAAVDKSIGNGVEIIMARV